MDMVRKLVSAGRWGAIALGTIVAGTCIAAIPFNLTAERQEKAINLEIETLHKKVGTDAINYQLNTSAMKLQHLSYGLGFDATDPEFVKTEYAKKVISERDRDEFNQVQPELQQYLDAELTHPSADFTPPPPQLNQYWQKKAKTIAEIRSLLRYYDTPRYLGILTWMRNGEIPNIPNQISGLKDIQNLLLLDAIAQYRQGKINLAWDNLDAAYKLSLSAANRVSPREQADYLALLRQQAVFMRKFDEIPAAFVDRLAPKDYHDAIATSLRAKLALDFAVMSQTHPSQEWRSEEASEATETQEDSSLAWSGLFGTLYLRRAAIASYQINRAYLDKLTEQNVCAGDLGAVSTDSAWQNWDGEQYPLAVTQLWQEATNLELEIELTQLAMQAKAIAAKTGKLPQSLPNLASSACPGVTWQYHLKDDGTALIQSSGEIESLQHKL
jgi:hypothetical protein